MLGIRSHLLTMMTQARPSASTSSDSLEYETHLWYTSDTDRPLAQWVSACTRQQLAASMHRHLKSLPACATAAVPAPSDIGSDKTLVHEGHPS